MEPPPSGRQGHRRKGPSNRPRCRHPVPKKLSPPRATSGHQPPSGTRPECMTTSAGSGRAATTPSRVTGRQSATRQHRPCLSVRACSGQAVTTPSRVTGNQAATWQRRRAGVQAAPSASRRRRTEPRATTRGGQDLNSAQQSGAVDEASTSTECCILWAPSATAKVSNQCTHALP